MARTDVLSILYAQKKNIKNFDWDKITAPPMLSILSQYDISLVENICNDPRLLSEPKKKKQYIEEVLKPRGLVRFAAGTNRVVYKYLEDQSVLFKIATSQPGINDSTREFFNQNYLKPFCAKCHEVSPKGVIGSFERVETINSYEQYLAVAEDHFNLLLHVLGSGKYIMEDIGTKFWRNIGIRTGFGVIFVDYPMLYELDGNRLFCNSRNPFTGLPCGGEIDYDPGFNHFFCCKCGLQYMATDLAKKIKENKIVFKKGRSNMKMVLNYNGKKIESDSNTGSKTYLDKKEDNKKIETLAKGEAMSLVSNWNEIKKNKKDEKKESDEEVTIEVPVMKLGEENNNKTVVEDIDIEIPLEIKEIKVEESEPEEEPEPNQSSLFGGVEVEPDDSKTILDSVNYQYIPGDLNQAKSDRRQKLENDKKKGKGKKNNYSSYDKYSKNSYSPKHSPVPRKGLNNNMSYNMESDGDNELDTKFTHF